MTNENVIYFDENQNSDSEESIDNTLEELIADKNSAKNNLSNEKLQEQIDVSEEDKKKYKLEIKDLISDVLYSAYKKTDVSSLKNGLEQIKKLEKFDTNQNEKGLINIVSKVFNQGRYFLTGKQVLYESKSYDELKKSKELLKKIESTNELDITKLNNYLTNISSKLLDATSKTASLLQECGSVEKDLKKQALEINKINKHIINLKDEDKKNHELLLSKYKENEIDLFEKRNSVHALYLSSLNFKDELLIEKKLTNSTKYGLNYIQFSCKNELSMIETYIEKHEHTDIIKNKLENELGLYEIKDIKKRVLEREVEKINIYNEVTKNQPKLNDLQKSLVDDKRNTPLMKSNY